MPTVHDAINQLRGRLLVLRRGRNTTVLGAEIGVHGDSIQRFFKGESVREYTLLLMEAWCDREEARLAKERLHA